MREEYSALLFPYVPDLLPLLNAIVYKNLKCHLHILIPDYDRYNGETLDNIILGLLPKRIIIGFVNNKAFNGDRALNPFNFEHFNINFLCLYVACVQVPSKPLQPNFGASKLYIDAYHTLFSGTGVHFLNEGNQILRESYPNGSCLSAFDLTSDL